MRLIAFIAGAGLMIAAAPAGAQDREAEYTLFGVTRTEIRRGHEITSFELAGAPISVTAYGRKARARLFDSREALREARVMSRVYEGAPRPALITVEMRLSF
ncbi:MAG: hypothetical protein ACOZAA_10370 [Pseudomonadota bacterium]